MALLNSHLAEPRFVTETTWDGYLKILDALSHLRVRVTFDRGVLELLSPSRLHERLKKILAALLECLMEESGMDFEGGGSTWFRRFASEHGLELDESCAGGHDSSV